MSGRWRSCAGLLLVLTGLLTARAGAAGASGEISREEIPKLLQKARSAPTMQERVEAIRTLGGLSEPAVIREFQIVKALIDLSKSPDTGARERKALLEALRAIRLRDRTYHPQVSRLMIAVLTDPKELVVLRREAIETFQRVIEDAESPGAYAAVKAIVGIAGESDEPVLRAKALEAVGDIAPREGGLEALRKGVMDQDPVVRRAAVQALPRYLERRAASGNLSPMIGLLQQLALDEKLPAEVRVMAMEGLGGLARRSANPAEIARALRPVLEGTEDPEVAQGAARALGLVADREAVGALAAAFGRFKGGGENEKVRVVISSSLGEMFGDFARERDTRTAGQVAEVLLKALQDAEESNAVRRAAAYAIGNMNQRIFDRTEAARVLIDVLLNDKTADRGLKAEIVRSLEFLTPTSQKEPEDWKAWFDKNKHVLRGGR